MSKRLPLVDGTVAVALPSEWLAKHGHPAELELEEIEGGWALRPVRQPMSFEAAAEQMFSNKDELLERLSNA